MNIPDYITDEKVIRACNRLNEHPTIKNLIKLEKAASIHILDFIIGDIKYEGPANVDTKDTKQIYPYVNRFFNIDAMIKNSVNNFSFWCHLYNLIRTKYEQDKGESADIQS